jgi:DNA-binding FrmR family transcriptional regulator
MTPSNAGPRGIAEETVQAKTGKSTQEWTALLDAWGAAEKGHTATARYLEQQHGVSAWWAQSVTVRYEYARGLRQEVAMPPELSDVLAQHPAAQAAFDRLSPSHQREHIKYVVEAKKPETRIRRAEKTIQQLIQE